MKSDESLQARRRFFPGSPGGDSRGGGLCVSGIHGVVED